MQKMKILLLMACSLAATPAFASTLNDEASLFAYCQAELAKWQAEYQRNGYSFECVDEGIRYVDEDGVQNGAITLYGQELSYKKYAWEWWWYKVLNKTTLTIASQPPKIPSYSVVSNGKVLTRSLLTLSLRKDGKGAAGQITLTSNRGSLVDWFLQGGVLSTDQAGNATAPVYTRAQPATSTITASVPDGGTPPSTAILWLPARYENSFLITCYPIANEADWPRVPSSSNVCGLPEDNSYRARFLQDVRMQGSGVTLDGTIIHYNANLACYSKETCARTATGVCAVPGTTIAVDPTVVPWKSSVSVDILGQRKAQDTGGRIKGYHFDDYVGAQPALCRQLGRRHSGVTFSNY